MKPAKIDFHALAKKAGSLYTLPDIYYRLDELIKEGDVDWRKIRQIILFDPALVSRILRLAGSQQDGAEPDNAIRSITSFLHRIDLREMQDLLLAAVTAETFQQISPDLLDMEDFWYHSVYTALIARFLARRCHLFLRERMFTVGLLHDLGLLVLYQQFPEYAAELRLETEKANHNLDSAERRLLGFSHGELGAALFNEWRLPKIYQTVTRYHHIPSAADNFPKEVALIHLADVAASRVEPGDKLKNHAITPDPWAFQFTGLGESDLQAALEHANLQFFGVLETITPGGLGIH